MGTQVESRERTGHGYVPTGDLPPPEMVKVLMSEAYEHFRSNAEGRNSDIYPALVRVPPRPVRRVRGWHIMAISMRSATRTMLSQS